MRRDHRSRVHLFHNTRSVDVVDHAQLAPVIHRTFHRACLLEIYIPAGEHRILQGALHGSHFCQLRLGDDADGLAAEVHKLNGRIGVVIAVIHLMSLEEVLLHPLYILLRDGAGRDLHLKLIVLSHIAHLGHIVELAAVLVHMLRVQPLAALRHQIAHQVIQQLGRRLVIRQQRCADIALFDVRCEEAQCAQGARRRRDQHRANTHLLGQLSRVEGAGPAVGHHGEIGGVITLFHCDDADCSGHVGIHHADNALRRFFIRKAHGLGDLPANRLFGQLSVNLQTSPQHIVGVDAAQNQICIRHHGIFISKPVSGRAWVGTRALRSYLQRACVVDIGDAAAASAYRMDIDHGHTGWQTTDLALGRVLRDAAVHQRHIGTGAAHVVGDDILIPGSPGHINGTHDAGAGAG